MKLQHHKHVLTHLVLQHKPKSSFTFSEHIPKPDLRRARDQRLISELEDQLSEARELLEAFRDSDSEKYALLSARVKQLSDIINQKKI